MGLLPVALHQWSSKSDSSLAHDFSGDQLKRQSATENGAPASKCWRSWQAKYITCVAIALGVIFLLSSVFVTEQSNNKTVLDRITSSFKNGLQTEGLSGLVPDGVPDGVADVLPDGVPDATPECLVRQKGEELPRDIVVTTSDLQMRSLYGQEDEEEIKKSMRKNLLAMAVGIKQKKVVNDIVKKFPLTSFTIMLFHYDGVVDRWQDLPWSNETIHIVALRQTKWWFAKRFMHPSIVNQYNYIFLWDEDLGVEHFQAERYLKIMRAEGLEISQPALDPASLEIHHKITVRHPHKPAHKSVVTNTCSATNKGVPCTGYVEVMAPVFTKAAWKCVWHMIQNDLIHGWGIDLKIGYCAQGLRSEKVGIIDGEYILHKGIPSLGGPHVNTTTHAQQDSTGNNTTEKALDPRHEVRVKSSKELLEFQRRWAKAAEDDPAWEDPYKAYAESERYHHKAKAPAAQ